MTQSIIKPKRPKSLDGWRQGPPVTTAGMDNFACETWQHRRLRVISAVEVVEPDAGDEDLGPEFHLSISRGDDQGDSVRCSPEEAQWVLGQFDLEDAEEDNHIPSGIARHFWRPVADRFSGYVCPCQDNEPAMVEDDGAYIWRGVTR